MSDIERSDPLSLSRLLSSEERSGAWNRADLRALLIHQLAVPLIVELREPDISQVSHDSQVGATLGELLGDPNPSRPLLLRAKELAKQIDLRPDSPIPPELATLLYYAVIAAARVRLDISITELPDASLIQGIHWALNQEWITPDLSELFQKALGKLQVG